MNWLKENKFLAGLIGGILLGLIALWFVGSSGKKRYEQAKSDYDAAVGEVTGFERSGLYPNKANEDGKKKAIGDYRNDLVKLQDAFAKFRPGKMENVTPQAFGDKLKAADTEVRNAFGEADARVPDAFFCGFESYKTALAPGNATGVMSYQLDAIRDLMLKLAQSGASELKNLHRPPLVEESGGAFSPSASAVARAMPVEITFSGPPGAGRAFFSSIVNTEQRYYVVRSFRVMNSRKGDPPKADDAEFDKPAAATAATAESGGVFSGGGFVLPGDEETQAAAEVPPAEAPPAPAPVDSSKILAQVAGAEEVQMFIRLDIMQFLPPAKLP